MDRQIRIDFHGSQPSEALQRFIGAQFDALLRFYGRITSCQVKIATPGRHHRKGGLFRVAMRVGLPGGQEVNVGTTPTEDARHGDILFAISDAFRRAKRQLQDESRKMRSDIKMHESVPSGQIVRFDPNTGYGFIHASDGHEVYFDRNSVVGGRAFRIRKGMPVSFVEVMGEKGPQASTVKPLGKHAQR
jgi:cold shock CspA family protein